MAFKKNFFAGPFPFDAADDIAVLIFFNAVKIVYAEKFSKMPPTSVLRLTSTLSVPDRGTARTFVCLSEST